MLVSNRTSRSSTILVLFKDGTFGRYVPHHYTGACMTGDPTVYVIRGNGNTVWVKPGASVEFVEV